MSDAAFSINQEKAVMHTTGTAQVFAGPGSGKTYVTVWRIRQLVTTQGIDPSHILVITFTKAAALEMQERFFRLMEPDRPPVRFGTFHAVFYHILKQSPQYRAYSIITESEKKKLVRKLVHMHKRFIHLQEEDLDELIRILNCYKNTSCIRPLSVQGVTPEDILFLAGEYETYLQELHQMDFDDIIRYCHLLLIEQPDILTRWQQQFTYIMIDEFQDISPKQYQIVRLLAAPQNNLFIVGDDDQSIYGFRGASPDSMQEFMHDYPEAERIFLDINYRCGRQITEASLKVIGQNRCRVDKQIRAANEGAGAFRCLLFESEEEEAAYLLSELAGKHADGRLSQCAMICRTNYECALWAQSLHGKGIPFSMKEKPQSPFEHFVVRDIMAYLALADGALYRRNFLRVMNRPVRYLKRDSLTEETVSEKALLAYYAKTPAIQEEIRRLFRQLASLPSKKPHLQIHYIRKVIGYDRYLTEKYGAKKGRELIETAVWFQQFAEGFRTRAEINDYISQYSETLQEHQEPQGICLLTMHGAKGLEFDTVYVPGCLEGKIPSAKSQTEEEIEEERRMFYVAMTRAKHELCLSAYHGKTGKEVPSRFLACFT